jgi:hypothetical protein
MALLSNGSGDSLLVPDVKLEDLNILDVGNTIQITGAIWSGNGKTYLVPLPDEYLHGEWRALWMDAAEWERFLNQSDVLDVQGPGKAILRKSQRQIDQHIAWQVFRRDGFVCRYCGAQAPLTVDHIILWEQGGASVEPNLISACRRCNKLRGSMEYCEWLDSSDYRRISVALSSMQRAVNESVRLHGRLEDLRKTVAKPRSR